jgi:hypothetical protein
VEDEYFQNSVTKQLIQRVLTVWCANHYPQYRQGMHEICGLLLLALNQEAVAWSLATPSHEWTSALPSSSSSSLLSSFARSNRSESVASPWAEFMSQRSHRKKGELLRKIKQETEQAESEEGERAEEDEGARSLRGRSHTESIRRLSNELTYCLCEESELYALFDRVMRRGLRVVYCPEVTEGFSEGVSPGDNPSLGYLDLIQGQRCPLSVSLFVPLSLSLCV